MDFHSLTRRELQALCKKNKIPANITNIAMADALKALEIVEGMEELLKPCESETAQSSVASPEKTVKTSPGVPPRTGCRTSTRRKVVQKEPESSQILTRTSRGTRRTITGDVENAMFDVPTTPAMPSNRKIAPVASTRRKMETQLNEEAENEKNVPEMPKETITRRQATGASARQKTETKKYQKEEASVLKVYSTRRTMRLSEKKMMELELNDNDKEMSKDVERIVKEDSDDFGKALEEVQEMHQQTISDDVLVKTDDLEALSDKKSDLFPENVSELEDNVQECIGDNQEIDDVKAKPQQISEQFHESDENKDDDDDSQTKSGMGCENYGESVILSGEKDDISDKEGCDDSGFDTLLSDTENPTDCLVPENVEGLNADIDLGLKDSADVLSSGSIGVGVGGDAIDPVIAPLQSSVLQETNHLSSEEAVVDEDLVSEDSAKTESDVLSTWIVSDAAEAQKEEDVESQNLASKESECFNPELNDGQDLYLELATKELSDEKAPCDDAETDLEAQGVQDLESSLIGEDKVLGDDAKVEFDHPEHSIVSKQLENEEPDQLDIESSNEDELDSDKSSIIISAVLVAIDAQINFDHPEHSIDSKQLENEHHPTPETVDCGEEPDQLFIEPSKEDESDSEESDSEKSATIESAVQVAIDPSVEENMMFSANPISSHPVISENNTIEQLAGQESIDFVNLVASADPSTLSCPTSLTPMKKSSTTTPTTNRKINSLLDDGKDKENIDKSGNKLDLTKEKPKKDKKELINEKSLRQLRKIFKEKLRINEEKNVAKAGRVRPALQTLSENRLAATETEDKN
ncbi:hypothetical protein HYC85_001501 [Camellia sinensis]|uniref:Uncharacterized protein n=1 Tax=Camellia sinensis TaxID=4442 RepID=A0A7J7I5J4_CAMSI|nr:hypothetical protein HYC85_001501 [Camellia sinensis]